jgi:hypothetical protein
METALEMRIRDVVLGAMLQDSLKKTVLIHFSHSEVYSS